jgi:hypothetical protein
MKYSRALVQAANAPALYVYLLNRRGSVQEERMSGRSEHGCASGFDEVSVLAVSGVFVKNVFKAVAVVVSRADDRRGTVQEERIPGSPEDGCASGLDEVSVLAVGGIFVQNIIKAVAVEIAHVDDR